MPARNLPVILRCLDPQERFEFINVVFVIVGRLLGPVTALFDPLAFRGDFFKSVVFVVIYFTFVFGVVGSTAIYEIFWLCGDRKSVV